MTGQCNKGCDEGWTGFFCDKGEFCFLFVRSWFFVSLWHLNNEETNNKWLNAYISFTKYPIDTFV